MKSKGHNLLFLLLMFYIQSTHAFVLTPKFPDKGVLDADNNAFISPSINYEEFMGRVSDKDKTGRIFKIHVQNNNTKFLKAGDEVRFKVNHHEEAGFCIGSVRSVEDFYFSIYVKDMESCWKNNKYFPRGMLLSFKAQILGDRVFEASKYRELLIMRKESFLKQLSGINHFLWTYDQQKIKEAAIFDQRINELLREKQMALDGLIQKKQDSLILQGELASKLDRIDESLQHYKVERQEYLVDRWNMDHDESLPVGRRPQKVKVK